MRTVILIFALLVAILLVIFGAQNTQLVSVHFLMIDTGFAWSALRYSADEWADLIGPGSNS
jgi:uncharacterized membrane protein YciS (DUF1049 family)